MQCPCLPPGGGVVPDADGGRLLDGLQGAAGDGVSRRNGRLLRLRVGRHSARVHHPYPLVARPITAHHSVTARLGKGQGAKEIGHNLARERPEFGHNLVRKRHKIFYA